MKKIMFAVSCLLPLYGSLSATTSYKERKQHIKHIMQQIQALNKKADTIIQQRDRLTAHLRVEQKRYRGES
jgi:hypothetical protein